MALQGVDVNEVAGRQQVSDRVEENLLFPAKHDNAYLNFMLYQFPSVTTG